jgi:hypothetical protein
MYMCGIGVGVEVNMGVGVNVGVSEGKGLVIVGESMFAGVDVGDNVGEGVEMGVGGRVIVCWVQSFRVVFHNPRDVGSSTKMPDPSGFLA